MISLDDLKKLKVENKQSVIEVMTLVWVFLHIGSIPTIILSLTSSISIFGIFYKKIRDKWQFWLVLFLSFAFGQYFNLYAMDNHMWLFGYWLLCIIVSKYYKDDKVYVYNIKLLFFLVFMGAFAQRLIAGEFLNGKFYEFELAGGDNRFRDLVRLVLGYSYEDVIANETVVSNVQIINSAPVGSNTPLYVTFGLKYLAIFISYFSLVVDFLVGLFAVLSIFKQKYEYYFNIVLLAFIILTYAVVSVPGFGVLLVIMGLAQNKNEKYDFIYVLSLVILVMGNSNLAKLLLNFI